MIGPENFSLASSLWGITVLSEHKMQNVEEKLPLYWTNAKPRSGYAPGL